eukprot:SAG31_NODE_3849_length_3818_cov_3.043560_3_plen_81_part_00
MTCSNCFVLCCYVDRLLLVAAYTSTFHAASAAGGEHTFNELVKEQTPGGMNEQVLTELTDKGNFENIKAALDKLLPRLLG